MHTTPGAKPGDSQDHGRYERDARCYEMMRDDIVERLRPVCAHMNVEDFERLVTDVCDLKFRWMIRERDD